MKRGVWLAAAALVAGCYTHRPSKGGGQIARPAPSPRRIEPSDIRLPEGYRIEAVATGLTFPTGVTFDGGGRPVVVEGGYSYGEAWTYCNQCHPGGEGGLGPALNNKPAPAVAVRLQVRKGLGAMPSFDEHDLSDRDMDDIVRYVLVLRERGRDPNGRAGWPAGWSRGSCSVRGLAIARARGRDP
jgi:hypothetical protein